MNEFHHLPTWQQTIISRCHHPTGAWKLFPTDAYEASFPARFAAIAARFPHRLAVVDEQRALTYAELNAAANRVAHGLIDQLGTGADPIIHLFEPGIDGIIALLGVAKAGKFYVPFDSLWPEERLAKTIARIPPKAILTDQQNERLLQPLLPQEDHEMAPIYTVQAFNTNATDNPPLCVGPDDYLYVTFTSGSTGIPKGVINNHRTVIRSAAIHINSYHICPDDRALMIYRFSFNGGSYSIYGTLMTGSSLYLYDIHRCGVGGLADWIRHHGLTITSYTPSVFRLLADGVQDKDVFATVRLLSLGGDRIRPADLLLYAHLLPDTACFRIAYGSTEAALCTQFIHDKQSILEKDEISAGWPIGDMEILIVDEEGNQVPQGEAGEIVAHSRFTASGYWQEPTLTARKFQPDPEHPGLVYYYTGDNGRFGPDGRLYPLGRKDTQVKINGQRVELGEIEHTLLTVEGVCNAVVALHHTDQGKEQLVAWLVWQPLVAPWRLSKLRSYLAERLPPYMIPVHFIVLEQLPLNINGKVDRRALPLPDRQRPPWAPDYVAPRSPIETQLAEIWAELLTIDPIGIYDNFFELGGHSLLTVKLMMQIEKQFAVKIPLLRFFEEPTITQIATWLEQSDSEADPTAHSSNATPNILPPQLAQLYDSVGVVDALVDLMPRPRDRRWSLIHHTLQTLPYGLRLPVTRQLTRPPARSRLFHTRVQGIKQFLTTIDTAVDKSLALDLSLFYGLLYEYKVNMVRQSGRSLLVDSTINIAQTRSQGKGVLLLHSHTSLIFWWKKLEMVEAHIGGAQHVVAKDDPNYSQITDLLFTHQVDYARKILQQGGWTQIAADGIHGKGGTLVYHFHGRQRPFMTGFAELALATNAQVIPLLYIQGETGVITRALGNPLDAGDETMSHAERVEQLVSQYVALLAKMWAETPWLVPWYQMKRHLAYPSIDNG